MFDTDKIVTVWDAATRKDMHAQGWHCVETHVSHLRDTYGSAYFMYPPEPPLVDRLRELADLYVPSSRIAEDCMAAIDELERLGKIEARIHELETEWGQANNYVPITWHGAARLIREAVWEFETDAAIAKARGETCGS